MPKKDRVITTLPRGMRWPKKPPHSDRKHYPYGQASCHCRKCCRRPDSSSHAQEINNTCGGEFGTSGSSKFACCPKCGTKWQVRMEAAA